MLIRSKEVLTDVFFLTVFLVIIAPFNSKAQNPIIQTIRK